MSRRTSHRRTDTAVSRVDLARDPLSPSPTQKRRRNQYVGTAGPPLVEFLGGESFVPTPHSIVYARLCKGGQCNCGDAVFGGEHLLSEDDRLVVSVLQDEDVFAVYVGLTKRPVSKAAFAHAKGPPGGAVRKLQLEIAQPENADLDHVVVWHAITRVGWGRGRFSRFGSVA